MKKNRKKSNVINLANHPAFEKIFVRLREKNLRAECSCAAAPVPVDRVFLITILEMLGPCRTTVRRFIKMKLDKCRRQIFVSELEACREIQDECRCLKKYIQYLKINDARALFLYINDILLKNLQFGQLKKAKCHGNKLPESRLSELAKKIVMSDADVNFCSCFFY